MSNTCLWLHFKRSNQMLNRLLVPTQEKVSTSICPWHSPAVNNFLLSFFSTNKVTDMSQKKELISLCVSVSTSETRQQAKSPNIFCLLAAEEAQEMLIAHIAHWLSLNRPTAVHARLTALSLWKCRLASTLHFAQEYSGYSRYSRYSKHSTSSLTMQSNF